MRKITVSIDRFEDVGRFVNIMDRMDGSVKLKCGSNVVDARSVVSVIPFVGLKALELWIHQPQRQEIEQQIQVFVCQAA